MIVLSSQSFGPSASSCEWSVIRSNDLWPLGDPRYDVSQHLLNCNASLQAHAIGLLT